MQTASNSFPNQIPSGSKQAPPASVPLSVYRQLAAELQAVETKLETLSLRNQQLTQENQVLRQEITNTIQSVLKLQNLVDDSKEAHPKQTSSDFTPQKRENKRQRVKNPYPPVVPQTVEIFSTIPQPQPVYIEEQEVHYYTKPQAESSDVNGWWLMFGIIFITFTAFGTGYFIVRPLVQNHSH